jgi:hypothetical protein
MKTDALINTMGRRDRWLAIGRVANLPSQVFLALKVLTIAEAESAKVAFAEVQV